MALLQRTTGVRMRLDGRTGCEPGLCAHDHVEMLHRRRGSIKYLSAIHCSANNSALFFFFLDCYNIGSSESVERTRLKLDYLS